MMEFCYITGGWDETHMHHWHRIIESVGGDDIGAVDGLSI
jgi:hypothetical protein